MYYCLSPRFIAIYKRHLNKKYNKRGFFKNSAICFSTLYYYSIEKEACKIMILSPYFLNFSAASYA